MKYYNRTRTGFPGLPSDATITELVPSSVGIELSAVTIIESVPDSVTFLIFLITRYALDFSRKDVQRKQTTQYALEYSKNREYHATHNPVRVGFFPLIK